MHHHHEQQQLDRFDEVYRPSEITADQPNPSLKVYCAEQFIESWPSVARALSSGSWSSDKEKSLSKQRVLDLTDTPLLDARKVDIELGCRSAVLLYDLAHNTKANASKEISISLAKTASVGCYRDLTVILVLSNVTDTPETPLAQLQICSSVIQHNSMPPTSVHFIMALESQLAETIADLVFVNEESTTLQNCLTPIPLCDLETQRAQFLLDIAPTFTGRGAIHCLGMANKLPGKSNACFSSLLKSEQTRQKVCLRITSALAKEQEATAAPIIQLSEAVRVDTRQHRLAD
jgi:hypothetical protein